MNEMEGRVWSVCVCVICGVGGSGLSCPASSLKTMAWKYMTALSN